MLSIELNGISLNLLPQGGVFLPDSNTLVVADPHFGKEASFRRQAIAVPTGSTSATLKCIGQMLDATGAQELVFLGDFVHDQFSLSQPIKQNLESFLRAHPSVCIQLIPGNHDRWLELPDHWPIQQTADTVRMSIGGQCLLLTHACDDSGAEAFDSSHDLQFCGHVHPAICVGHASSRLRLRCFWQHLKCLTLPAVGDFTGSHTIRRHADDRVWLLAEDRILEYYDTRQRR